MSDELPLPVAEVIDFLVPGPSLELIVSFQASETANARIVELIRRDKTEGLSDDEGAELDECLEFEHIVRLVKARAHQLLNTASNRR